MAIKVFISWGGELSRNLAEAIHDWLPNVLQAVKPYFTPNDLEKGVKWHYEISKELDASNIGLLCLTRDNIHNSWILFEAGALSKKIDKSRVCPILFGLEPTDLKGPLAEFEATKFTKEEFKKLISTINNSSDERQLQSKNLEKVFEKWWPELDAKIKDILAFHKDEPKKDPRTEMDILIEILELVRMLAKPEKPSWLDEQALREMVMPAIVGREWATSLGDSLRKLADSSSHITEETFRKVMKGLIENPLSKSKAIKPDKKK